MIEALIGLGGVVVGLMSGHLAEWIRWGRAEKKAKKVRELELKRELYLPLASAFTESLNLLATVANAPPESVSDIHLSLQAQSALATKDLVANDEVLYSAGAAAKEFALGFARLMTIKAQEAKLAVDLKFLSAEIEPLNRDNALINDQFEALSAQGKLDQQFLDVYQRRFKRNGERLDLLLPEQTQKLDQKSALILRMNKQAIEEVASLSGHVAKAVIAIRKDLELPPNASVILDHYRGTIDEMAKMMPKFMDDVWSDLDLLTEGEQDDGDQTPPAVVD